MYCDLGAGAGADGTKAAASGFKEDRLEPDIALLVCGMDRTRKDDLAVASQIFVLVEVQVAACPVQSNFEFGDISATTLQEHSGIFLASATQRMTSASTDRPHAHSSSVEARIAEAMFGIQELAVVKRDCNLAMLHCQQDKPVAIQ